jgi:hypothetical protein
VEFFTHWKMIFPLYLADFQQLNNVGNPTRNLPFGDGLYHPWMAILGMVYYWIYQNT